MKNNKKFFYLILLLFIFILSMIFVFLKKNKDTKIKIGILQIVEHESLDNARKGFIDRISEIGFKNVEFDFQIAGGDLSNCVSISEKFVNDKKDLILAISTPCAIAAANATKDIPILATAITDFEGAGLIKSNNKPDTNVTGTSDLAPIGKIIELIKLLNPNALKIGVLYSNTDASPQYQASVAQTKIKDIGLTPVMFAVSEPHEITQAAQKLASEVDELYVPIDKITASAMPQISEIFLKENKFVVCAEDIMLSKGAIGTYGVDYYELGKITANQASKILKCESKPQNMPIEHLNNEKLLLNSKIIEKLKINIPDNLYKDIK